MFGHQLFLPVPDIDRTSYFLVFGANPMASNGSLMTVPDFPQPAARAQGARRPDGGLRPAPHRDRQGRRPSTTSSAPAPTPSCCWRCSTCCSPRGWPPPPPYVDGLDAVEAAVAAVHPRAGRGRSAACPPTRSAGSRASSPPPTAPSAYGRIGVSTHELRHGLPVGDQPAQHPHRQPRPRSAARCSPTPPSTSVGTGLDRPRPPRPVAQPGARPARSSAGELPVAALREEIETPGDGQIRAMLTRRRQPGALHPRRRAARRVRSTGLDFMAAVDIYVNETTRHADVILPPTTALERDHYDLVFHALAVRNTARFTPAVLPASPRTPARLGDLPRDRAAHRRPAARQAGRCKQRLHPPGPAVAQPDPADHRAAAPRRQGRP